MKRSSPLKRAAWLAGVALAAGGCTLLATLEDHAPTSEVVTVDGASDTAVPPPDQEAADAVVVDAGSVFSIELRQDAPWVRAPAQLHIAVHVNRGTQGAGAIALALTTPPSAFVPASPLTIAANASDADLVFDINPSAAQGIVDVTVEATLGTAKDKKVTSVLVGGAPGTLDTSWSSTGVLSEAQADSFASLVEQPDGKLVAFGSFSKQLAPPINKLVATRFDPSGQRDLTFGGTGRIVCDLGEHNTGNGVALVDGLRIFGVGSHAVDSLSSSNAGLLLQLTSNGGFDPLFPVDGGRQDPSHLSFQGVVGRPDASAIVVGIGATNTAMTATSQWIDGGRDLSFAGGELTLAGESGTVAGSSNVGAGLRRVALDPNNKVVVLGDSTKVDFTPGFNRVVVVIGRYNADGTPDPQFNGGTDVRDGVGVPALIRATGLAVQSDAKIVVTTTSIQGAPGQAQLVRYLSTGARDVAFASGGVVTVQPLDPGGGDGFRGVDVQADSKLVVAQTLNRKAYVVRYTSTGVVDPTFAVLADGGAGGTAVSPTPSDATARAVRVARDGRIYVAATKTATGFVIARYWP